MTVLAAVASPSRTQRVLRFPLTRMVLAVFLTALAVGGAMSLAESVLGGGSQGVWLQLLGAAAALGAYALSVRLFERRAVGELSLRPALPELGAGLLGGALLVASVVGALAALGAYAFLGRAGVSAQLLVPLAEMTFVGVFEEVLSRGIVFGIAERSLGTWLAMALSSLLFGLAHLPGEGAGLLSVLIAIVAGAFFAAAYVLTRHLWLCIGLHVAWNYTLGTVFSIAVSGRESVGLLRGRLTGPEWLTGGRYGLEASLLTLLVLLAVGAVFLWRARARGHLVAPSWRRGAAAPERASAGRD